VTVNRPEDMEPPGLGLTSPGPYAVLVGTGQHDTGSQLPRLPGVDTTLDDPPETSTRPRSAETHVCWQPGPATGRIRLWDIADPTRRTLAVQGDGFQAQDEAIQLWDISRRGTLRELARLPVSRVNSAMFSPDRRRLITSGSATLQLDSSFTPLGVLPSQLVHWDTERAAAVVDDPVTVACAVTGRDLSDQEWQRHADGLPRERTCPTG
jgi:WD40 repeat protein